MCFSLSSVVGGGDFIIHHSIFPANRQVGLFDINIEYRTPNVEGKCRQ